MFIFGFVAVQTLPSCIFVGCGEVTCFARGDGVKADERKFGEVVIEKDLFPPPLLGVARLTLFSLLTPVNVVPFVTIITDPRQLPVVIKNGWLPLLLRVAGFAGPSEEALVFVVSFVTSIAGGLRLFLIELARVTCVTVYLGVSAYQDEFGAVMVENGGGPLLLRVTVLAVFSITAPVFVIGFMTSIAGGLRLLLIEPARVTCVTVYLGVSAYQDEFGAVMDENGGSPLLLRVTVLAVFSIAAVVGVIQTVARETVLGSTLVTFVGVTGFTRSFLVFSFQRKTGLLMARDGFECVTPGLLHVTVGAGGTQAPFVRVQLPVAIYALGGCIPVLVIRAVTLGTRNTVMPPLERKIRYPVIKHVQIQRDDVRFPTLVFSVAVLAFDALHLPAQPMKTGTLVCVLCDLLVATQAEVILGGLAERLVAQRALIFVLGVPGDDRAGHDQALQFAGRGDVRRKQNNGDA